MKVKDVMGKAPLITCNLKTTLQEAAKLMKDNNCGVLPVMNDEERLIGIITDRDICLSLAREFSWSHCKMPVGEIMSDDIHYVQENDNLTVALKKMREHFVGRLPVVDDHGKATGILSIHTLFTDALVENKDMGHLSSSGENIVKTVKALSDRYALQRHKKTMEEMKKSELKFVF
jgi:CBS domain-containing protein